MNHIEKALYEKVEGIAARHDVRIFDPDIDVLPFGVTVLKFHPHIMKFMHCDVDAFFLDIKTETGYDVEYSGPNNYIMLNLGSYEGAGSVKARFNQLMDDLEIRFPMPSARTLDSSRMPEEFYLEEIDKLITERKT